MIQLLINETVFGASIAQKPLEVKGVKLTTYPVSGMTMGFALTNTSASSNEFIGHIVNSSL
jgi:hypothetical protein